jgi:hypothetical protein
MHGASYVSDALGSVLIRIKDERQSNKYRQLSGIADILLCRNCGVLVGVLHRSDERQFAAINAKVVEARARFAAQQPASPKKLSDGEKVQRSQRIWFSNASVINVDA